MCYFHCLDANESTFSIERFPCFAVGFRWKGQAASRARILSWSGDNLVNNIVSDFLGRIITNQEILHFSFNHRSKKRLIIATWFAVKMLFWIYSKKCLNKMQLLDEMLKEIQWNLKMTNSLGCHSEVASLKMCISRERN